MAVSLIVYLVFSLSIGSAIQRTWCRSSSPWQVARDTLLISLFWPIALLLSAYDQIDSYRGGEWVLN